LTNLQSVRNACREIAIIWARKYVELTLIVEVHTKKLSYCLRKIVRMFELDGSILFSKEGIRVFLKVNRRNFSSFVKERYLFEIEAFKELNDDFLGKHTNLEFRLYYFPES